MEALAALSTDGNTGIRTRSVASPFPRVPIPVRQSYTLGQLGTHQDTACRVCTKALNSKDIPAFNPHTSSLENCGWKILYLRESNNICCQANLSNTNSFFATAPRTFFPKRKYIKKLILLEKNHSAENLCLVSASFRLVSASFLTHFEKHTLSLQMTALFFFPITQKCLRSRKVSAYPSLNFRLNIFRFKN